VRRNFQIIFRNTAPEKKPKGGERSYYGKSENCGKLSEFFFEGRDEGEADDADQGVGEKEAGVASRGPVEGITEEEGPEDKADGPGHCLER
jgi:hypothetical protein